MDRDLPFSFLDHKIRCGNSLIGAWFDQFQHYPAMAWKNREAGDKNHSNGVHYQKGAQTKAIKEWVKNELTPDLRHTLEGRTLFHEDLLEQAAAAHGAALEGLERMHRLPIRDSAERARLYREELTGTDEWRSLKNAMDLWCSCWFWPADELDCAPLPTTFSDPAPETRAVAERVAAAMRFFHWELEFPDVFREEGAGFDAMLGNPPWDIAKPKSQEFFSSIDPLYRSYGKQEALRRQNGYFDEDPEIERDWLAYNARFRAQSNFVTCAASPFGDPEENDKSQRRFGVARGKANLRLHDAWREARQRSHGYADAEHPFRHQGSADLNLYKLFLEQTHALLREDGRFGFVVPSGLYSDQGTGALRDLFLERCAWEWLFGFENRLGIFPIYWRFKFNPIILQKGGKTAFLRTMFMRRDVTDWERAEEIAVEYSLEQVRRFSPKSRAILEIESRRDLEVLETIYTNSVRLDDDRRNAWGIRYAREFDMTNDSKLFRPRPEWERGGYRPDEYGRWLLGNWRPINELWLELGVNLRRPEAATVNLENWLFDREAGWERRKAERRLVHGRMLAPGDVGATVWAVRCAQPPYDCLPVPRVSIPEGIVLSRKADAWIREEDIKDASLPLFQGIMVQPFMPSARGWLSGTGLQAKWDYNTPDSLTWNPQFLMGREIALKRLPASTARIGYREVARSTDSRSFIGAVLPLFPCAHKVPVLSVPENSSSPDDIECIQALLNSFVFDWLVRRKLGGAALTWSLIQDTVLPARARGLLGTLSALTRRLNLFPRALAPLRIDQATGTALHDALSPAERLRLRVVIDVLSASAFGCGPADLRHLLHHTDLPRERVDARASSSTLDPRGFWRVDRDKAPELRHTVLAQVAFTDLQRHVAEADGHHDAGLLSFMAQNEGEGWLLPETLRLTDYGLGHDDRASHHQPVATELGPRFYDWQLAQPPQEARAETHLHARNLLGEHAYRRRLKDLEEDPDKGHPSDNPPLSEVAEERHSWDNWLARTDEGSPQPTTKSKLDQPDLFD